MRFISNRTGEKKEYNIKWFFMLALLSLMVLSAVPLLGKICVLGRPIFTYAEYVVFFLCTFAVFLRCVQRGKVKNRIASMNYSIFLCGWILLSFGTSIIHEYSIIDTIVCARFYVPIIGIAYYIAWAGISRKQIVRYLCVMCPCLAIVSLLSGYGYLSGIAGGGSTLFRASTDVDGSIGVCCLLIFLKDILDGSFEDKPIKEYIAFFSSIIIISFSFSRTRIVIALVAVLLYLLIGKVRVKAKYFIPIIVIIIGFIVVFNEEILLIIERIITRFSRELETDKNILYRQQEIRLQIDVWKENLLVGEGWGAREAYGVDRERIFDHCSYSSVLMYGGIVGFVIYFSWFVNALIISYKERRLKKRADVVVILLSLFALGLANAGFNKVSGIIMMMYIAAVYNYE